jgi:hypothetical protein
MEQCVAQHISDAEHAAEDNSRPENQAKESPSEFLLIVDRLSG